MHSRRGGSIHQDTKRNKGGETIVRGLIPAAGGKKCRKIVTVIGVQIIIGPSNRDKIERVS
jgi:hypothetical protein